MIKSIIKRYIESSINKCINYNEAKLSIYRSGNISIVVESMELNNYPPIVKSLNMEKLIKYKKKYNVSNELINKLIESHNDTIIEFNSLYVG